MNNQLDRQNEEKLLDNYNKSLNDSDYKTARKLNHKLYEVIFDKYKKSTTPNIKINSLNDLHALLRDGFALIALLNRSKQR